VGGVGYDPSVVAAEAAAAAAAARATESASTCDTSTASARQESGRGHMESDATAPTAGGSSANATASGGAWGSTVPLGALGQPGLLDGDEDESHMLVEHESRIPVGQGTRANVRCR